MYYTDLLVTEPDEPTVIPFGTGESEAIQKMYQKVEKMTNTDLIITWECLRDYDPRNYYDKDGKIGMDTWANAIYMELSRRNLPTF